MSDIVIHEQAGAVRFSVRVQPRSDRNAVMGVHAGALKVKLTAPPVDGAANAALIVLLAERLNVSRACIRLVGGATARVKLVEVQGVNAARVRELANR